MCVHLLSEWNALAEVATKGFIKAKKKLYYIGKKAKT